MLSTIGDIMVFVSRIEWTSELTQIRSMGLSGMTFREIGEHYGVSKQRIAELVNKYKIFEAADVYGMNVKRQQNLEKYKVKWGNKDSANDKYQACRAKFRQKKANALRSGIEFTVDFGTLDFPTHCPILGIELDYFSENGRQENNPSFDRKDCSKGYVNGNVFVISWRANRIKNDGTAEEHRRIVEWMIK